MRFKTILRLFFVLVVVVPVVGLGAVIVQLRIDQQWAEVDARLETALTVGEALYTAAQADAVNDAEYVAADEEVIEHAAASDYPAMTRRLEEIARASNEITAIGFGDGDAHVYVGPNADEAFAHARADVIGDDGAKLGFIDVSVREADDLLASAEEATEIDFVALRGESPLAATLDGVVALPVGENEVSAASGDYRLQRTSLGQAGPDSEHIAALIDTAEAKEAITRNQLWVAGLVTGFFLLALVAATFVGRALKHFLRDFIAAARRIAGGNFNERLPEEGNDEFAQLGREFNTMSAQIENQISQLEGQQAELELAVKQATTDDLTGLSNTRELTRALKRELSRVGRSNASFGFILLDLDDFKKINDTHGHRQGDQVLIAVGGTLRQMCRDIDLAVRYGGEEMAVVLPDTDTEGTLAFAERLRTAIDELRIPMNTGNGEVAITASFGVLSVPAIPASDPSAVFAAADEALYRAKALGKNRIESAART